MSKPVAGEEMTWSQAWAVVEQAKSERRCPYCLAWFMTRAQRQGHEIKQHGGKS